MSVNLNLISIIKSEWCPWNPLTSINLNYVTNWGPFISINLNYVRNWNNYYAYNLALDFSLETKLYPWKYFINIVRALRPWPMFCKLFEGIWNNYVDIEHKIMQVRFIIFLCTWGYISLGDLTWQHEVWRKILLNTKWADFRKHTENIPSD